MRLRDYQQRALCRLSAAFREGYRRIVVAAPTGAGKTTIAAEAARRALERGRRVLALAHRRELIDQLYQRFAEFGHTAGVVMASDHRADPAALLQVASVDTLIGRDIAPPDLVIIDEAHRTIAASYREIVARWPRAYAIGLTATPYRMDGRGLGEVYDHITVAATYTELIAAGHLLDVDVYGSEYREGDLVSIGDVVAALERHQPTCAAVFCRSVDMSRAVAAALVDAGISAAHIDGTTPARTRAAAIADLRAHRITALCNVDVLTEGWDLPALDCIVLARRTGSLGLYRQIVGRVLRPSPGKAAGLVLDFAANVRRHGWPTSDLSEWYHLRGEPPSLTSRETSAEQVYTPRQCLGCWRVYATLFEVCPACGWVPEARVLWTWKHTGAQLRQMRREQWRYHTPAQKRQYWHRMQAEGLRRGWHRGGAWHRFIARYGETPAEAGVTTQ